MYPVKYLPTCIIVLFRVQVKYISGGFLGFVYLHKYEEDFMGSLYENIYSLCRKKGIRPGKMCEDLGISRGLITDLKMGRKKGISTGTACKMAEYFGVPLATLLGEPVQESADPAFDAFCAAYGKLSQEDRQTVLDLMEIMDRRRKEKGNL